MIVRNNITLNTICRNEEKKYLTKNNINRLKDSNTKKGKKSVFDTPNSNSLYIYLVLMIKTSIEIEKEGFCKYF